MKKEIVSQKTIINQCDKDIADIYHSYAAHFGLTPITLWIIYFIWNTKNSCTQSDICTAMYYNRKTVHSAIKSLEQQGYILREELIGNKKCKQIVFTPAGREFACNVITPLISAENKTYQKFEARELDLLVKLSGKRVSVFRQEIQNIIVG